jgi:hypothetical protein
MSDKFSAKLIVSGRQVQQEGTEHEVVLLTYTADYNDDKNKEWSRYTPSMGVTQTVLPEVAEGIQTGDTFDVLFTKTN